MRRRLLLSSGLLSLALSSAVGPDSASKPVAEDAHSVVHGMTVSCPGSGRIWGSDEMIVTRLTRPIAEAHRLGLKIMIKPHIAHWGSSFSWRGEIGFETDEQWQRFFETYETWITMVAQLAADADAFVVGTELGGTVHREKEWRQIIAAVRQEFRGPLTYSPNWGLTAQPKRRFGRGNPDKAASTLRKFNGDVWPRPSNPLMKVMRSSAHSFGSGSRASIAVEAVS